MDFKHKAGRGEDPVKETEKKQLVRKEENQRVKE